MQIECHIFLQLKRWAVSTFLPDVHINTYTEVHLKYSLQVRASAAVYGIPRTLMTLGALDSEENFLYPHGRVTKFVTVARKGDGSECHCAEWPRKPPERTANAWALVTSKTAMYQHSASYTSYIPATHTQDSQNASFLINEQHNISILKLATAMEGSTEENSWRALRTGRNYLGGSVWNYQEKPRCWTACSQDPAPRCLSGAWSDVTSLRTFTGHRIPRFRSTCPCRHHRGLCVYS